MAQCLSCLMQHQFYIKHAFLKLLILWDTAYFTFYNFFFTPTFWEWESSLTWISIMAANNCYFPAWQIIRLTLQDQPRTKGFPSKSSLMARILLKTRTVFPAQVKHEWVVLQNSWESYLPCITEGDKVADCLLQSFSSNLNNFLW